MNEWYGYAGRILRIDLSKQKIVKAELNKSLAKAFIGGRGINSKILFDEVNPGIDAFSPENLLIFGTGPATGTIGLGTGRYTVSSKSPLTGILGDANSGGFWAPELKYAGYDHIIIKGISSDPVYLWIDDDHVELRDAKHLWGLDTWQTDKAIKQEIGDEDIQIACIGQAGENLVRYACIINNLARAAGRTGMGAVMGSKRLKAIAVRGSKDVKIAKQKEYIEYVNELCKRIYESPLYKEVSTIGTPILVEKCRARNLFPVNNFQYTQWSEEKIEAISGKTFHEKFSIRSKACFGCPIHCSHFYSIKEGPYAGTVGEGIEYEVIGPFGIQTGTPDIMMIVKAHELCSKYSIDTCSCGNVIATAMEWYQKGIITKEDTGGIELKWGDVEAIMDLVKKICFKEGFGRILAEGVKR
ncbi:MAG: aldehyde ferredoxin oxidoreductase N-terminal domain-containing protein, partial [Candidatus Bathyarchaeia archaeon]